MNGKKDFIIFNCIPAILTQCLAQCGENTAIRGELLYKVTEMLVENAEKLIRKGTRIRVWGT